MLWVSKRSRRLFVKDLFRDPPRFHSLYRAGWSDPDSSSTLSGHETSWDLSPFAAVLAPGHTSAPEPKNKKKLQGTKNNCACVQLGQIMDNNIRKTNPHPPAPCHCQTTTFEELGAKAGCNCPLHTPPPKGWVNQLSHLSRLTLGLSPYPHLM